MIGLQEVVLILAILLIVFGPKKLPEMAKELGKAIREFNKATASIANTATSAFKDEEDAVSKLAQKLDIDAEGKSTTQLVGEIERKMVKNKEGTDTIDDR